MASIQTSKVYLTVILLLNFGYLSFIGFQLQTSSCIGHIASISRSVSRTSVGATSHGSLPTSKEGTSINRGNSANDTLWMFTDEYLEKIYFYDKLINKEQRFNKTNLKIFREQLISSLGEDFNNYLVVHQDNTPLNSLLKYNGQKRFFNITEEIHQRLPRNFTVNKYERCTVVGNSGTLLGSKCGKGIDNADFVYRCNAAPIDPYIQDAGSKTNVTSFNPSILGRRYNRLTRNDSMSSFLRDMKKYQGIVWASCFSFKAYTDECMQVLGNYTNTEDNQFVLAHPDHFKRVATFWKERGFKKRLSSGFYLATAALMHCNELNLYGFWPFTYKPGNTFEKARYHYYDKLSYNVASTKGAHGMNTEFALLAQLHLRGILKLHVGSCYQGT